MIVGSLADGRDCGVLGPDRGVWRTHTTAHHAHARPDIVTRLHGHARAQTAISRRDLLRTPYIKSAIMGKNKNKRKRSDSNNNNNDHHSAAVPPEAPPYFSHLHRPDVDPSLPDKDPHDTPTTASSSSLHRTAPAMLLYASSASLT